MEPSVDPLGIAALGWVVVQPGPDERFLTVHPPRGRGSAELLVDLAEARRSAGDVVGRAGLKAQRPPPAPSA